MAFLAPAFLALAALVGVPILVHFLRRRAGRSFDFPAVRYLLRMEQEHHRDVQLRNRRLLLLRLLAVLALAIAAARPLARLVGTGHAPVAMAIIIDNSMSTGMVHDGRQVLADLKREADELLAGLGASDRAWVVTADGRVAGGNFEELRDKVASLQPLGGRGDLGLAMRRALELSRSGAPRAAVVAMATDGQASSLRSDSIVAAGPIPIVVFAEQQVSTINRAVLDVVAEPVRWTPGGSVSFSISSPDSASWRVVLDGRTVARGIVPPSSFDAPARVTQRLASAGSGWVRGSVELDADALRADDQRWFAVLLAPTPAVDVRRESGVFLDAAFATLAEEGRVVRTGTRDADKAVAVGGADARGLRLPALLVAPRDPLLVGEANRRLEELAIPWRLGAISSSKVLAGAHRISPSDNAGTAASTFDGTVVHSRYSLVFSPGSGEPPATDTLAVAGGAPWVVAGDGYVLIGSAIDPDATDLPLRAGFVPWLTDIIARRLGGEETLIHASPGSTVEGLGRLQALETPAGKQLPIASHQVTLPSEAGVYYLMTQNRRSGAIVVNSEPAESDFLPQVSASELGSTTRTSTVNRSLLDALVSGRDVSVLQSGPKWRDAVFSRTAGRSLLLPLLLLAFVALMAESWISGRK